MDKQIKDLQDQMTKFTTDLGNLQAVVYKNNFGSTQTFNKDVVFSSNIRVPVYSIAPTVAEVGCLMSIGGTLYICTNGTVPVTWTIVGTQS